MKEGIWQENDEGLVLFLTVKPRSSRDGIETVVSNPAGELSLSVRVRAQPEKARANKAVISLLAKTIGIPRSSVSIIRGATGRKKTVLLKGNSAEISRRLENITNQMNPMEGGDGRCKNN